MKVEQYKVSLAIQDIFQYLSCISTYKDIINLAFYKGLLKLTYQVVFISVTVLINL